LGSGGGGGGDSSGAGRPPREFDDAWVREVAETPENDLRAHLIAHTYNVVANHLDTLIHSTADRADRRNELTHTAYNANWFHFATWATLTVTHNIGQDRAPQRLNAGVPQFVRRSLTPTILRARASQGQRVGRALAWGQRLIFVAAGLTLLEFFEKHEPGPTAQFFNRTGPQLSGPRADLLQSLTSWGNESFFDEERHFQPLWRAFQLYELAREAKTTAAKAQLIFGANLLITAVEQDLVNEPVRVVVEHIPRRVADGLDWRVARAADRLRGVPPQLSYAVLQSRRGPGPRLLDTVWSRVMTDQVLVMALPTETLRVGRDIPPRHPEWPYFPPDLRDLGTSTGEDDQITGALAEIARHVMSLDRTAGDGRGSAARDWRRWDERMNWAMTLMRSRQQDETLFWHPYSDADVQRILDRQLPLRAADPSAGEVQPPIGVGVLPTFPKSAGSG
jgi:hypothetical protein